MGIFTRKKTATELMNEFCNDLSTIARRSPLHDADSEAIIQSEVIPFAFSLFDSGLFFANKNRYAYQNELSKFLDAKNVSADFDNRIEFYTQFIRGKKAQMQFWLSDHSSFDNDWFSQPVGAFCDLLYAPYLKDDYDNVVLNIVGIDKVMVFTHTVFMPILKRAAKFIKEIRSL